MKKSMSDSQYVAAAGVRCPYCRSKEVEAKGDLEADGRDCWQDVRCAHCHKTWRDVYRLVGYESTDEPNSQHEVDARTGIYLVFVEGDIEPQIIGPFADAEERDSTAHELRRECGEDHGIFMLNVDPANGKPTMGAYCGGFFREDDA